MKTKYLTIKPSSIYKDSSGDYFPDIFSFPINNLIFSETPQKYTLSANDIKRFDILVYRYYGSSDYKDLVLWVNNISNLDEINPGFQIILPIKKDIENFYRGNIL